MLILLLLLGIVVCCRSEQANADDTFPEGGDDSWVGWAADKWREGFNRLKTDSVKEEAQNAVEAATKASETINSAASGTCPSLNFTL